MNTTAIQADTAHLHDGPSAVSRMAANEGAAVVRLRHALPTHAEPLPLGHHLIGLCGAAGSGKSTAGSILVEEHEFHTCAFADSIREMLDGAFGPADIDHAWYCEPKLKELPIPELGISGRVFMQTLGTEWGRALDPALWVRLLARRLGMHDIPRSSPVHDRIVITDVRFPEEAAWVQALGGHVVLVDRPDVQPVRAHESEAHYRRLGHTATVENHGGMEQLRHQVAQLVEHVQLLDALPLMP